VSNIRIFLFKSENNYESLLAKYTLKRKILQIKFVYKNRPHILPPIRLTWNPLHFLRFFYDFPRFLLSRWRETDTYIIYIQSGAILEQCYKSESATFGDVLSVNPEKEHPVAENW